MSQIKAKTIKHMTDIDAGVAEAVTNWEKLNSGTSSSQQRITSYMRGPYTLPVRSRTYSRFPDLRAGHGSGR
jgi:hypothetical protein